MKNRYIFFKRLFPEYVIIFDDGKKRKSLYQDKILMKYIGNKDINYVVVDNEFNISIVKNDINNYKKYVIKLFLYDLLEKLKMV